MTKEKLKAVDELLEFNFVIPSYQRGYRWKRQQVEDLLDDIWEFSQQNAQDNINKTQDKPESFYCLQPLIVKQKNNDKNFIVLDGQQRLTTIFLILKFLDKNAFEIKYKTRLDSKEFLDNIKNKDENESGKNIDFFHIYNAYKTIKNWFEKLENQAKNKFADTLLKHTKIIWYENNDEIETQLFARINMGKIPLTNAELIKALLLKNEKESKKQDEKNQLEIATQWDLIEKDLQVDDFWYFLSNDDMPTRIDVIFRLLAEILNESNKKNSKNLDKKDEYHAFRVINKTINNKTHTAQEIWCEAKDIYRILKEWFNDREFFHKIGFLLADNNEKKISFLMSEYKNKTKDEFKKFLNEEIKKRVDTKGNNLETLQYHKDDELIRKILLLFNIQSLLANENSRDRFNFADFKKQKWDIEHIHSQNENIESRFVEWFEMFVRYGKNDNKVMKAIVDEIGDEKYKKIIESNINKEFLEYIFGNGKVEGAIQNIYKKYQQNYIIDKTHREIIKNLDSIKNLTLLDSHTNRSYQNAFFPIKRNYIIESDKTSTFVPLCTRNVFVKYYSANDTKPQIWSEDDADSYLQIIKETLKEYLGDKNE